MTAHAAPTNSPALETAARSKLTWAMIAWIVLMTVLGGALRLHNLGEWSFWEDELFSIRSVAYDGTQLSKKFGYVPIALGMHLSGTDVAALEPTELHNWQAAGVTEWRARIGPCVVGIISIPLLALLTIPLLGTRGAALLALLLALSPWHIFWSQATRFYTLQFLFYNLTLLLYFTATEQQSTRKFVLAMITLVFAYLAQPPALLIGLVFAGDWILGWIRRKPVRIGAGGWIAGVIAVGFCLALHVIDRFRAPAAWSDWGKLEGHNAPVLIAGSLWENHIVIVAFALLAAAGLIRLRPRLTSYLLMGGILPIAALTFIALVPDLYSHVRYGFIAHFSWLLLAAMGLAIVHDILRDRANRFMAYAPVVAVVAAIGLSDYVQLTVGQGNRRRWNEAFEYVIANRQPHHQVASERPFIARYYLQMPEETFAPFPRTPARLTELDEPTWLVTPIHSATRGIMYAWLRQRTELKAQYDLRVVQPFSSIAVYFYDPARHGTLDEPGVPDAPQIEPPPASSGPAEG